MPEMHEWERVPDPQYTPAGKPSRPTYDHHQLTWRSYANRLEDYAEALSRQVNTLTEALAMLWAHYLLPITDEQKAQVIDALASASTESEYDRKINAEAKH